eukprot:COSAG06_NODE_1365_length_9687_cov_14.601064_11_plen_67_part_00
MFVKRLFLYINGSKKVFFRTTRAVHSSKSASMYCSEPPALKLCPCAVSVASADGHARKEEREKREE